MGKKIKNVLSKVTKVGSLGAFDLDGGGWGMKVVDPLGLGTGLSDQLLGTDFSGAKSGAAKDAASIAQQNAAREQQAQTFAQNMSVDLGSENIANVDPGGTADAASTGNRRKKRQGGSSASSSLGINY